MERRNGDVKSLTGKLLSKLLILLDIPRLVPCPTVPLPIASNDPIGRFVPCPGLPLPIPGQIHFDVRGGAHELDFKDRRSGRNNCGFAIFTHCYMNGQGFYSCNALVRRRGCLKTDFD